MNEEEPTSKREEQRLETRRKILKAATKLFLEKSIHDVSTNDIAEYTQFAKGTIFHHFESKENLIREVIIFVFQEELNRLGNFFNSEEFSKDGLKRITKEIFHDFMDQPGLIKLILDFSSSFALQDNNSDNNQAEFLKDMFEKYINELPKLFIRFGVPEEKAIMRSHLFLAALDGIGIYIYLNIIPNNPEYVDQLIDEFIELLFQGE